MCGRAFWVGAEYNRRTSISIMSATGDGVSGQARRPTTAGGRAPDEALGVKCYVVNFLRMCG